MTKRKTKRFEVGKYYVGRDKEDFYFYKCLSNTGEEASFIKSYDFFSFEDICDSEPITVKIYEHIWIVDGCSESSYRDQPINIEAGKIFPAFKNKTEIIEFFTKLHNRRADAEGNK